MPQTELGGDDENVLILLLVAERLEELRRPCRLAQAFRTELAFTVVVELAVTGLLDHVQYLLHRFVVGRGDLLPPRNGEPSFGVRGKRAFGQLLGGIADAGEQLAQAVRLFGNTLRLVAGEVAVLGFLLLVLELVGDRQVLQRGEGRIADCFGEFVAVFDDALGAGVVQSEFSENLLDGVGSEPVDLLDLTGRSCCLSNRLHDVISFRFNLPKSLGYDLSLNETSFICPIG